MQASATSLRNRLLARARLRHLQVFVKVAELQTVRRAAEAVGITQPTATQALADLERLLEGVLFLRHSQGMTLTATGRALLPMARRMLGLVDDTAGQAAALARGAQSVVRVGAISAAVCSSLRDVVPAFARTHPQILLQLQEGDASRLAGWVADGDVDCALCREPAVRPAGWAFTPLWPDRFVIVCGPAHPLTRKPHVGPADWSAATWLTLPPVIAARAVFDRLFEGSATGPDTYGVVTASPVMLQSLLAREDLLALVPASVVQPELESGRLVELPGYGPVPFDAIGVLSPVEGRGPALQSFLQALGAMAGA